jgi:SAM-dependent methyltransferase
VRHDSIEAYDRPQRVATYDAEMEVMHPNRSRMVRIALDILPFERTASLVALDLGAGTAYFSARFLDHFPHGRVVAVDGAKAMVDLARERLKQVASRADLRIGDLRDLSKLVGDVPEVDLVFSSYALHHLDRTEKHAVLRQALDLLRPGGWFVNADVIVAESSAVESRIQDLRVAGIVERAAGRDERFRSAASTRQFLDGLEADEGDRPLTLLEDLATVRSAGLSNPSVFWLEQREVVYGGPK